MIPDIERVTAPEYLDGLGELPIEKIRQMRDECQDLENAVSYVRRFAQARLDLVAGPVRPSDEAGLSVSLSGHSASGSESFPRPPLSMEPNTYADQLITALDAVVEPSKLSLGESPDDGTRERMVVALSDFEHAISRDRQRLHEIIRPLMSELVTRYRNGDATVDSLLT